MDDENLSTAAQSINLSDRTSSGFIGPFKVKECPLCKSDVSFFYLNLDEKILMCENTECEYPFNNEVNIYRDGMTTDLEFSHPNTRCQSSAATTLCTAMSTTGMSEINRLLEDEAHDTCHNTNIKRKSKLHRFEKDKEIIKKLETIEKLSKELHKVSADDSKCYIKNENYIQNLKKIQEMSGISMLKPEEIGLVKQTVPELESGELRIDITPGVDFNMSSIKIELIKNNEPVHSSED